jgi:hypothetical protein
MQEADDTTTREARYAERSTMRNACSKQDKAESLIVSPGDAIEKCLGGGLARLPQKSYRKLRCSVSDDDLDLSGPVSGH